MNKTSMLYWWDKVKDLDVPKPKTEVIEIGEELTASKFAEDEDKYWDMLPMEKIRKVAGEMGYPVFIRTDKFSGKHRWKDTCCIKREEELEDNIKELIYYSLTVGFGGVTVEAIVVREFIEMDTYFKAFLGGMPVNPERRYFVYGGEVICHHPYWIKDSVHSASKDNWEELIKEVNKEEEEVELLTGYAQKVADVLGGGYWSIDFCKAKDGTWYLIDLAEGSKSWHHRECSIDKEFDEFERRGRAIKKVEENE